VHLKARTSRIKKFRYYVKKIRFLRRKYSPEFHNPHFQERRLKRKSLRFLNVRGGRLVALQLGYVK
jgi:hypothetical protein